MAHSKSRSPKPAKPNTPKSKVGETAVNAGDGAAEISPSPAATENLEGAETGRTADLDSLPIAESEAAENPTGDDEPLRVADSFETNPVAGLEGETSSASGEIPAASAVRPTLPNRADRTQGVTAPLPDYSKPAPRAAAADSFEQNPLAGLRPTPLEGAERLALDDGTRLREALRSVIQDGDTVKDAAKDWNVTPRSIAEWRSRYQDLLQQDSPSTLLEVGHGPKDADLTHIPDAARELFSENWERLVTETAATPRDFKQSRAQIFLQTSPLTSWLFQDGELERGNLAGLFSVLVAIAIVTSFLIADRNPPVSVPLPEPPPRDDLVIDEASKVAESFLKAPNWQERLKFVRHPDAVKDMMEEYYRDHPDGPITDAVLSLAMPARHLVNLSYDIPSQGRSHFLCVVKSKGRHVVDWESSSIYQEARIAKLREEKSTQPTRIAVTLTKSEDTDYYNYAFRDANKWVCYKLGYPGLTVNLFGYAQRDSSDAIALDAMLEIVSQHAVVMEVRFPPDSTVDNQVEIISVLRNEWVPDEP